MITMKNRSALRLAAITLLGAMLFGLAAPHAFAAGEKQSYANYHSDFYDYGDGDSSIWTTQETVSYQVGSSEVTLKLLTVIVDAAPSEHADPYTTITEETRTYTFSNPISAVTRQGDWGVVFDVPGGTTVSFRSSGVVRSSSPYMQEYNEWTEQPMNIAWDRTKRIYTPEELYGWDALSGTTLESGNNEVLTVQKGGIYQQWQWTEAGDADKAPGGFIFRGV